MTPQERQLVDDLFDRLARLETSPREPNADAAIAQGLRRAPNAVYALVQTVLVQDEALKRADARIQELEGGAEQQPSGGFLDSMRDAILGPGQGRGSVPSVRPGNGAQRGPVWNSGQALEQADARMGGDPRMNADPRMNDPRSGNPGGGLFGGGNAGGGGSFLGTAAATAAGVIGGSMLMNSIRGMMGGGNQQQSLGNTAESGGSKMPWDNSQSSGNLARDAGANDVGKSGSGDSQRQSAYDQAQADTDQNHDDDDDDDDGDDD
ncbi:MAG TPA: DUF2076 domain-containing protein, partial [Afipia sp.]